MDVNAFAEQLLQGLNEPRMPGHQAKRLVEGMGGKRRSRRAGLLAPHFLAIAGKNVLRLAAQKRHFVLGEAAGKKHVAELVEALDLFGGEPHGGPHGLWRLAALYRRGSGKARINDFQPCRRAPGPLGNSCPLTEILQWRCSPRHSSAFNRPPPLRSPTRHGRSKPPAATSSDWARGSRISTRRRTSSAPPSRPSKAAKPPSTRRLTELPSSRPPLHASSSARTGSTTSRTRSWWAPAASRFSSTRLSQRSIPATKSSSRHPIG